MVRGAFTALALFAMAGAAEAQQRQTIGFEGRQKGQPVRVTADIEVPAHATRHTRTGSP